MQDNAGAGRMPYQYWAQIAIAQDDATPYGAIVGIDLRGPRELHITTSSGEDWTTFDAGRHWKRR